MKIENDQILSVINRYKSDPLEKKEGASPAREKKRAESGDRVELSLNNSEIEQLKQTMQGISDVRAERVASLKKSIDEGTYSVSGDKVAEKMLDYWKSLHDDK
jgi:negative regulator of flagellin synthesis FlgM